MQILLDNIALGLVKNIMIKNQGESMYVDHLPCMVKFVNIFYRLYEAASDFGIQIRATVHSFIH